MESSVLQESTIYLFLLANPGWVAISIIAIAFIESFAIVGVIVPGVAMLYIAAFVAGTGTLSLPATLVAAFIGAVFGDGVSFLIGRIFREDITTKPFFRAYRDWLDKGEDFIHKHGIKSVIIGRFLGPIRPVIPLAAGVLAMPAKLFLSINVLSAIAWAPVYILPGYLVGAAIDSPFTSPTELAALAIGLLVLGYGFYRLRQYFGRNGLPHK